MFRIALLLALLSGGVFSSFHAVWEMSGPSSDPNGKPNGQNLTPELDSGPSSDPFG